MKTKQFLHSFFGVFMLVIFMASFSGCSDDDDDDNDNAQTYLELYEGSTWELDDVGGVPDLESIPAYFRLVNNVNIILEGWYDVIEDELDCYYYVNGINVDGGNMSLTENSETKLVIKITFGATETETFTCTVQGDVLSIAYLYEEDGEDPETYTIHFNKTNVNVDELPLCPV